MRKSLIDRTADSPIGEYLTQRRQSQKGRVRRVVGYLAAGVAATAIVVGTYLAYNPILPESTNFTGNLNSTAGHVMTNAATEIIGMSPEENYNNKQ